MGEAGGGRVVDPIKPLIMRPDVLDDKNWIGGFETGFVDNEKTYSYMSQASLQSQFYINTDMVKDGELKSIKDLLDPKWKGKLLMADVRTGYTFPIMWVARRKFGDDFVRQLLVDQKPVFSRDPRQIAEQMVRGNYPVATGIVKAVLQEFKDQGLGQNIKYITLPEVQVETSFGTLWHFNKAKHPNASKMFLNWILTQDGQKAFADGSKENSRRVDVAPQDPELVPKPGPNYLDSNRESMVEDQEAARKFFEDLLK